MGFFLPEDAFVLVSGLVSVVVRSYSQMVLSHKMRFPDAERVVCQVRVTVLTVISCHLFCDWFLSASRAR